MTDPNLESFKVLMKSVIDDVNSKEFIQTGYLWKTNKRKKLIANILKSLQDNLASMQESSNLYMYFSLVGAYGRIIALFENELLLDKKEKTKVKYEERREHLLTRLNSMSTGMYTPVQQVPVSAFPEEYLIAYESDEDKRNYTSITELYEMIIGRVDEVKNVRISDPEVVQKLLELQQYYLSLVITMDKVISRNQLDVAELKLVRKAKLVLSRLSPFFQKVVVESDLKIPPVYVVPPLNRDIDILNTLGVYSVSSFDQVYQGEQDDVHPSVMNHKDSVSTIQADSATVIKSFHRFFGPWIYFTPEKQDVFLMYLQARKNLDAQSFDTMRTGIYKMLSYECKYCDNSTSTGPKPLMLKSQVQNIVKSTSSLLPPMTLNSETKLCVHCQNRNGMYIMDDLEEKKSTSSNFVKDSILPYSPAECMDILKIMLALVLYYPDKSYQMQSDQSVKYGLGENTQEFNSYVLEEIFKKEATLVKLEVDNFSLKLNSPEEGQAVQTNNYYLPREIISIWNELEQIDVHKNWMRVAIRIIDTMQHSSLITLGIKDCLKFPLDVKIGHPAKFINVRERYSGIANFMECASLYDYHFTYHVEDDIRVFPIFSSLFQNSDFMKVVSSYINNKKYTTTVKSNHFIKQLYDNSWFHESKFSVFTKSTPVSVAELFMSDQHKLRRSLRQMETSTISEEIKKMSTGSMDSAYTAFRKALEPLFGRIITEASEKQHIMNETMKMLKNRENKEDDKSENAITFKESKELSFNVINSILRSNVIKVPLTVYIYDSTSVDFDRFPLKLSTPYNSDVVDCSFRVVIYNDEKDDKANWYIYKHKSEVGENTTESLICEANIVSDNDELIFINSTTKALNILKKDNSPREDLNPSGKRQRTKQIVQNQDTANKKDEPKSEVNTNTPSSSLNNKKPDNKEEVSFTKGRVKFPPNSISEIFGYSEIEVRERQKQRMDKWISLSKQESLDNGKRILPAFISPPPTKSSSSSSSSSSSTSAQDEVQEINRTTPMTLVETRDGLIKQLRSIITTKMIKEHEGVIKEECRRWDIKHNNDGSTTFKFVKTELYDGNTYLYKKIDSDILNYYIIDRLYRFPGSIFVTSTVVEIGQTDGVVKLKGKDLITKAMKLNERNLYIPVYITKYHYFLLILQVTGENEITVTIHDNLMSSSASGVARRWAVTSEAKSVISMLCTDVADIFGNYSYKYKFEIPEEIQDVSGVDFNDTNSCGYYVAYQMWRTEKLLSNKVVPSGTEGFILFLKSWMNYLKHLDLCCKGVNEPGDKYSGYDSDEKTEVNLRRSNRIKLKE